MTYSTTFEIDHKPAYASIRLTLQPGQTLVVEAGAMAAMDPWIKLKSKMRGGLGRGVMRMFGGESLFLSEFTAEGKPGELYLSPGVPGDVEYYHLDGTRGMMLQSSGFVASSPTVEIDTKFQGFKGFFSGESIFLVHATGQGDLWFSTYGAIIEIPIDGDYVVDTSYVVAFEDSLQYNVELIGGLSFKSLRTGIFGGEGLVCRFNGQGRLWVQTRGLHHFINFVNPFRPVRSD